MKLLNLKAISDERGSLLPVTNLDLPFDVKRVFFIYGTTNSESRGFHANMRNKELIFCLNGSVKIILEDSTGRHEFILDNPTKGLYVDSFEWIELHEFKDNPVLTVLNSEDFKEKHYIRDYDDFKKHLDFIGKI